MKIQSLDIYRLPNGRPTGTIRVLSLTGFETAIFLDTLQAERILGVVEGSVQSIADEMAVELEVML